MRDLQDTFETSKQSFIGAFSNSMTEVIHTCSQKIDEVMFAGSIYSKKNNNKVTKTMSLKSSACHYF